MTSLLKRTATLWLAGSLLAVLAGCTQLDLSQSLSLPKSKPKPKIPERMVDAWSDTVLHQTGQRGVRGFGGRVMFYAKDKEEPVVVDGSFTVYAFDDSHAEAESDADLDHKSPEKKYVFPQEQLADHYSQSPLGHSYSFWIPWDEVGGAEKRITLISRFVDATGHVVMSKPCHQTLPGILPESDGKQAAETTAQHARVSSAAGSAVYHASFDEMPAAGDSTKPAIATTTIDVPPSFARRLRTNSQAPSRGTEEEDEPDNSGQDSSSKAETSDAATESEQPLPSEQTVAEPGPTASHATRSAPSRFPVRRERATRQAFGHVRTEPHPAMWPSALPRTPRPDRSSESTPTSPADAQPTS